MNYDWSVVVDHYNVFSPRNVVFKDACAAEAYHKQNKGSTLYKWSKVLEKEVEVK